MQREQVRIRPAQTEDVDSIFYVEQNTFPDPWSRESFVNEIENNELAHYFVAEYDEKIVGYGGYWQILDQAHITNIGVLAEYRGKGIARKLIAKIFEEGKRTLVKSFTLECRVSNEPAKKLYESMGFKAWGIRPKYYLDNNEDAIIMWVESEG